MAATDLGSLGLPPHVLTQLRALGVSSTDGLRAMVEAAPVDIERHLGASAVAAIERALTHAITPRPPGTDFVPEPVTLGARLDPVPREQREPEQRAFRDRLFRELQQLRGDASGRSDARVRELETELNALLEGEDVGRAVT